MLLSAGVLVCSLAIANLQRLTEFVNKTKYNADAEACSEILIKENLARTTVLRSIIPEIEYCYNEDQDDFFEPIDLSEATERSLAFNYTNFYKHVTHNSPLLRSGVLSINDHQELPLFLFANIRHRHIRMNPDGVLGLETDEQMALMGQLPTDDRVCLLPRTLGGARGTNVVPMAKNVYHRPYNSYDTYGLNPPLAYWKSYEDWIIRFLQTFPDGSILWHVMVQYADGVVTDPRRNLAYRPVAYSLMFVAYQKWYDDKSKSFESNQTTLLNNNDEPCGTEFRNYTVPVPYECRAPPIEPLTNSMGDFGIVTDEGYHNKTHIVSFPFTIRNRTFFYGQALTKDKQWFIRELLPKGKMGQRISKGTRSYYYKQSFAYGINLRQFLYSNRGGGGTYWFTQELLPDGVMGKKEDDGNWDYSFSQVVTYAVRGKTFFYGQVESISTWYIQELLPNGLLGKIKSKGYGISQVVFSYRVMYDVFLYSHDPLLRTWHTNELFMNGKMGPELSNGTWPTPHHSCFSYDVYGKGFFFAKNLFSGYWFVQEIYLNGTMGERPMEGVKEERYQVSFVYFMNRTLYFYGHDQMTTRWVIKRVL